MWFAAKAIFYYKLRGRRRQSLYVVHENIYLLKANDEADAKLKADEIVQEVLSVDDPTMTIDGRPAEYVFAGFRRIQPVWQVGPTNALKTGDEPTFSCYHVKSLADVRRLAEGKRTKVLHVI